MLKRACVVDQIRGLCLLAALGGSTLGCVHAPTSSLPPASAPAPTQPATAPQTLAAYCDAASKRRAAFTPSVSVEVRSASLVPRAGDEPRTLTVADQEAYRARQIFVSRTSIVSAADIEAAEIRPATPPDDGYDVLAFVKSPAAAEQRLLPMVGGLVAVFVDGRLIALPQLLGARLSVFSVSMHLTLPEALASAARFNPPVDAAGLEKLEQRCLDGEARLCVPLAEERLTGRDAPYDTQRAALLFEKACGLGLGGACERAAELATDTQEVTELLQRGCQSNNPNACFKLGQLLLERSPSSDASRIAQGKANLTLACDQGVGRACTALVDMLGRDYPGETLPSREVQELFVHLLEGGCTGGEASACFRLADISRRGIIGPADIAAAKRWLRAGCALDPTGGEVRLAIRFGGADPSLTSDLAEAGCSGQLPPPEPPRPSLCRTEKAR